MGERIIKKSLVFFWIMIFVVFLGIFSNVSAQTIATVTVNTSSLGTQIPDNFVGLSMEWQYAQDYFGTTSNPNNTFFQLMENLGNGVYRIGGNSTDEWCWDSGPSECQHQITSGIINSIFNASAQTGFGVIAGVNLTDSSTTNAVDTVSAFVNDGLKAYPGSVLIGAEIGNEPDLFDTSTNTDDQDYPTSYTLGDNESDYQNFVTALNNNSTTQGIPWVGPAFAGGWDSQLNSWLGALQGDGVGSSLPGPALITLHNYPLSNCGSDAGTGTISKLLSASTMNSTISGFSSYEQTCANYGYKLRVAETNSSACGGTPGVSDVEAAALWAMDDMFRYAQVGIVGVDFHGGGTSTSNGEDYSAVFTTGNNGAGTYSQGATVAPLYYALLMFANAQGKYLLPVTVSSSDNITAYAVASSASDNPEVFVINKDTSASGLVSIQPSESMTSATLLVQKGTSLSDSSPTYGGVQPNTSTGVLPSPNTTTLTPTAGGAFQFTLANASAAMITMYRGPTPTPVVSSSWRIVAGGPAHTDCQGNVWAADENYIGGTAATSTNTITGALPCTSDQALYQDQRYGTFDYVFNVPTGNYQVTLKFAETYFTESGKRVFNVSINGASELTGFDIYAATSGENVAIDKVFDNIAPSSGGAITIAFDPTVNNALIDSIQIIPEPPTATPTATATPITLSSWRVVAGGPAHTDCQGNVWAADENYVGGTPATSTNTITGALPCTSDEALYQDQRYGSPFSYVFNVPSGDYQVTLKFAETYFTAKNDRIFGVSINGTSELSGFDIYNVTGGENIAIDKVFNNIEMPSGGAITISFAATTNNALVDSLQIIPQPATSTPTPTITSTATLTPTASSTATLTLTSTNSPTGTNTPTLTSTNTSSSTATPMNSSTPTASSTSSMTPTVSATSSSTWTGTETSTSTMSLTPTTTPTGTLTPVNTPASTLTLTRTDTPTQTLTSALSSTATTTPTGTSTAIRTSTSTLTQTDTPIGIFTSTMTQTSTASGTSTNTATSTRTATATVTESDTQTPTSTPTPSPTASWTSTLTLTETRTPTLEWTWTSTATVQATWTRTSTPTLTATWTATRTPTPMPSDTPIGCSGIPDWNGNFVAYSVGSKVDYDGVIYECIQSHTSEANWEPPVVPALWKDLGPCGSTPEEEVIGTPVAYPNPATSSTIQIELPMTDAVNVKVKIYTVAMREVQSLDMAQVMGNTISMELKDKSGINLADGLYYFVIQTQGQKWINKVLVLR